MHTILIFLAGMACGAAAFILLMFAITRHFGLEEDGPFRDRDGDEL